MIVTTYTKDPQHPVQATLPPHMRRGAGPGRPPIYNSVEELQNTILDYYDSCWTPKIIIRTDINGNTSREEIKVHTEPYCMTGLACWLGICRSTLLNYQHENHQFVSTIKEAKAFIEQYAEKLLLKGKVPAVGVIFSMANNFTGWKDVRRTELTGPDGDKIPIQVSGGITMNDDRAAETREEMMKQFSGEDTTL